MEFTINVRVVNNLGILQGLYMKVGILFFEQIGWLANKRFAMTKMEIQANGWTWQCCTPAGAPILGTLLGSLKTN